MATPLPRGFLLQPALPVLKDGTEKMTTLRLILGDQLNSNHSWFSSVDSDILYCMFEMRQETDYVVHHVQKLIFFFTAMRNFASELRAKGHSLIYLKLDTKANRQDLTANVSALIQDYKIDLFEYLLPDEYRLELQLKKLADSLDIPVRVYDSEHFIDQRDGLAAFFGSKTWLLEPYYREMRKRLNLLMDPATKNRPLTGKWNYDSSNRKKLLRSHKLPEPLLFSRNVREVEQVILTSGTATIGEVDGSNFIWPTTRKECLELLEFFVTGCYQILATIRMH